MEKVFEKTYEIAKQNIIYKLHIPENNFGKINGTFQHIENTVGGVTTKRQLIRKSYFISVELIENVMRYGIFNNVFENKFLLAHSHNRFYFSSSNLVDNESVDFIKEKLDTINLAFDSDNSSELIREMYMAKLKEVGASNDSVKIGIIELARRIDSKILYNFQKVDKKHAAFSIICTVDTE